MRPEGLHTPRTFTRAGLLYRDMIRTLITSPLFGLPDLVALTPKQPGVDRDCVLVARFGRGEVSLRPEMYRIMRSCPVPCIRWEAVNRFSRVGTLEDVPMLKKVAEQDSHCVKLTERERIYLEWTYKDSLRLDKLPVEDAIWPVREHAAFVAGELEWRFRKMRSGDAGGGQEKRSDESVRRPNP